MTRFGPFRLEARLGVGGMGEVFRAYDTRSRRFVALKLVIDDGPNVADALEQEARLQKRLDHPGIIAVRDHGQIDGRPYLALEYVDGPTLSEVLTRGRMTTGEALRVALAVLEALDYAHQARGEDGAPLGIVHRDVSPQNILFTSDGRVKLGDFGIARARDRGRTRTGLLKGKLGYLAPEQVTQSAVDARTDLYQAGVVIFEMLTGEAYVRGSSEIELLRAAEAPVFRELSAYGVDAALDPIVRRALMRFPEERYSSARRFVEALTPVAARFEGAVPTFAVRTPIVAARPRFVSVAVILGLIAIAGSLAAWQLRREARVPPIETDAVASRELAARPSTTQERVAEPRVMIQADQASKPNREPARQPAALPNAAPQSKAPRTLPAAPMSQPTQTALTPASSADSPTEVPVAAPSDRTAVRQALAQLATRGIERRDLPPALQARIEAVDGGAADPDLPAALDGVVVDRAFVQRKLARLNGRIDALDPADPRRAEATRVSRAALQALLDGNIASTDASLATLERLVDR